MLRTPPAGVYTMKPSATTDEAPMIVLSIALIRRSSLAAVRGARNCKVPVNFPANALEPGWS